MLVSVITICVLISVFASLVGIPIEITTVMDKIYETNSSFHVK